MAAVKAKRATKETIEKADKLKKIIPCDELWMIEHSRELTKVLYGMAEKIDHIPALRETDGDKDAKCVLHYFDTCGSADQYVFEVDFETMQGFGYAALCGFDGVPDPCDEFGYIDIGDLCKSARINLDLHFSGITKAEILERKHGKAA